jgi:monooxygenase
MRSDVAREPVGPHALVRAHALGGEDDALLRAARDRQFVEPCDLEFGGCARPERHEIGEQHARRDSSELVRSVRPARLARAERVDRSHGARERERSSRGRPNVEDDVLAPNDDVEACRTCARFVASGGRAIDAHGAASEAPCEERREIAAAATAVDDAIAPRERRRFEQSGQLRFGERAHERKGGVPDQGESVAIVRHAAERTCPRPGPAGTVSGVAEHVDVIIVGAGLSGIGAAYHLQQKCPSKTFTILEGRDAIGGTWDLFRYPGIRSDSDMYTLGYAFKPWREQKAIADGGSILSYVRETARENGIDSKVRFHHRVVRASWSSEDATWTVEAERGPSKELVRLTCNFLYMCSGYYRYAEGYTPELPGRERFRGRVVHPQKWTEDIDYAGKRVVVIGSGATAVTLVPELAKKAAHVVMLQRSPTYVVSLPAEDAIANWLRERLPPTVAYGITRWKNVLISMGFYQLARRRPEAAAKRIIGLVQKELGKDYDVGKHFTPRYKPWDQRLCLVPDADLFASIRSGKASVVTDRIETFTEKGIRLASGEELEADLIVTATGLQLELLGGMEVTVDGRPLEASKTLNYKGMMFSDVPNLASTFGYTNASWTLKADLTGEYVCRLLNHMDRTGTKQCTPRRNDPSVVEEPFLDFSSGYVQRALAKLPRQGSKRPWKLYQNYALDIVTLRYGRVVDGTMEFTPAMPSTKKSPAEPAWTNGRPRATTA